MSAGTQNVSVFALGSGITLLGVLRTLSRGNAHVIALPDVDRVTRRSRWYRAAPASFAGLTAKTLPQALEKLPAPPVLMPCSDYWARAVAALPEEVRLRYPASTAPLEALDTLVDKARFAATLSRLNLPHPTTTFVRRLEDLDGTSTDVFGTSFLKPVHSQQFFARF